MKPSLTFLFLILTLHPSLFTLTSCLPQTQSDPQTIIVGIETYPKTLDPRYATDAVSAKICRLIYNGLFKISNGLEVVPDLVINYQYVSDTVLDIELKQGILFHHGTKLTAKDVIATYESIRDPKTASPFLGSFSQIKKIELFGDYKLRFILKKPYAPLLTTLTMAIMPHELISKHSEREGAMLAPTIGTGPYQYFKAKEGQKVILKKNNSFFGQKPLNNQIIFKAIPDSTVRTYEILQGSVDLVQNAIPYVLLSAIKKNKNLLIKHKPGINFSYLGFNLKDPILKNKKVRQAIAMAINREALIRHKFKNMATQAHSILSPNHWAYYSQLQEFNYNPKMAKKLLDEAGYMKPEGNTPRFLLTYKTSTNKDRVAIALLIAEQFKEVGIKVEVKPYEWGTFFKDVATGNFQIYTLSWVGVTEPDIFYTAFHSSQVPPHGNNRGSYQNFLVDSLAEEARKTLDQNKRKLSYKKIQEILLNELPYVPLWYEDNYVVMNKDVKGYDLRPDAGFEGLISVTK